MPGATDLLPAPVTTPPSSLGGVDLSGGTSNLSGTAPEFSPAPGGLDASSLMNQGMTSIPEIKAANDGGKKATNTTTFPVEGYVPPPGKVAPTTFMADWYRNGNYGADANSNGEAILPKMLDDFNDEIASIYVYAYDKTKKMDVSLVPPYSKFILESVTESHAERSQIVETFGDFYVFLFGERPPMYNFSGTLINAANYNWVSDFKYYYDSYLRGSKCVEHGARLVITYGGRQIEGFMLSMQTATDATVEKGVKVSFPVVVTRKSFIRFSNDFGFVTVGGISVENAKFTALLDKIAGAEGIGSSDPAQSQAQGQANKAVQEGKASNTTNFA